MEIRRPTKLCLCHYIPVGTLPSYPTEPGDDGQSRQVHVPVVLILLLLLVMVMVIVFACEWYMYHYRSKPV